MKMTEFFMKRPVIFWSFMVAIMLAGVLAFIQMPKLEDPAVAAKQAMVVVPFPGANAHEVELKVAQLMEDELRALPNVKEVRTECRNGSAMFTVKFRMTTLASELEQHFDLIRRKVNDAASRLPQGCYSPVVIDDMQDVYGIFYALTADGYSYQEMYKYAKYIRRELLDVKGVKRINIVGNRDEVINIVLDKERIARNGIIPTQIMSALQSAGKTVNAGNYKSGDERIALFLGETHGVVARLVIHVAVEHHLGAVALGTLHLDEGRGGGHDHDRSGACPRGGKRNALGMIACARGDDAAPELFGRERRDLVVGAAHLVGTRALHVLGLEEHAIARLLAEVDALDELGFLGDFLNLLGGLLERVER